MVSLEDQAEMMFKTPPTHKRTSGNTVVPLKPGKALPGFTTADLFASYAAPSYIIKGVLEPSELAVIFGDSGAMKSFAVIDLAMHIATGRPYAGHRVNHSGVLYVAGEGGEGIKRRLRAWMIRHNIGPDDKQPSIYTATKAADLMFDTGEIKATIAAARLSIGREISIVIFDTLAANFGDGDENQSADMTKALQTARSACGDEAAIILVHHVGHADKLRERGSYSLRGAADRRILVERPGDGQLITLTCAKAKDGEPFKPLTFEWHQVSLGWFDADGDELTSVILDPSDKTPPPPTPKLTARDLKALDILREMTKTSAPRVIEWGRACADAGLIESSEAGIEKAIHRIKNSLLASGRISSGVGRGVFVPLEVEV